MDVQDEIQDLRVIPYLTKQKTKKPNQYSFKAGNRDSPIQFLIFCYTYNLEFSPSPMIRMQLRGGQGAEMSPKG